LLVYSCRNSLLFRLSSPNALIGDPQLMDSR